MVHQSLSDQNLQNKADFFYKKEFPELLEFDNVPEDKGVFEFLFLFRVPRAHFHFAEEAFVFLIPDLPRRKEMEERGKLISRAGEI